MTQTPAAAEDRYADPRAVAEYMAHDGHEIVTSAVVDATVGDAFDAWLQYVWLGYKQGGETSSTWRAPAYISYRDVTPGEGRGLVGHTRLVPLGITEQIVSAGEPNDNDAQLIPSISYKLRQFGPLALKDHIALVQFVPDASAPDCTRVLWTIKTTATPLGNALLCGGAATRAMLRTALTLFLRSLAKTLRERKRSV